MSFFRNLLGSAVSTVTSYSGDTVFLNAAASAAANTTAADGSIDDSEKDKAIRGMMSNKVLSGSFTPAQIEQAYNDALVRAKSRAGRAENQRYIEAVISRPAEQRQDIFYIAADVADDNGIGDDEMKVLNGIGTTLNLDSKKLLAV